MSQHATQRRSILGPATLLLGGGLALGGGIFYAVRKSNKTVEGIEKAIAGTTPPTEVDRSVEPPAPQAGTGGYVNLRTTGYWPFTASESERKMEGGVHGAAVWRGNKAIDPATGKRPYLVTVEQHRADPSKHPYVSLSGDDAVWPLGQKVIIPWTDGKTIVGRIVDTGQNFRGAKKVYRVAGYEPIDVCVHSKATKVPTKVMAQIVVGDNWEKGRSIAAAGLKGQTVTAGIVDGRTQQDEEALARAIESETGERSREEQEAAAWSIRNRADALFISVYDLLAPNKAYGAPNKSGGYASTRRAPTETSRALAADVLGAGTATDPTGGAVDFWVPEQQEKLRKLGDVYRAAVSSGDGKKAKKYERYASYGSESDVRLQQTADGLRVLRMVGIIELLGKM